MATNQSLSSHKYDVINLKSADSCKTAANDVNKAEAENEQIYENHCFNDSDVFADLIVKQCDYNNIDRSTACSNILQKKTLIN